MRWQKVPARSRCKKVSWEDILLKFSWQLSLPDIFLLSDILIRLILANQRSWVRFPPRSSKLFWTNSETTSQSNIQLFQLRLSPEQSVLPSSLSRSYSTFPLCSGDNLNWNSCITICHLPQAVSFLSLIKRLNLVEDAASAGFLILPTFPSYKSRQDFVPAVVLKIPRNEY
jgi:hypothetical protein